MPFCAFYTTSPPKSSNARTKHFYIQCLPKLWFSSMYLRKVLIWRILSRDTELYQLLGLPHSSLTLLPAIPNHNLFSRISFFLSYRFVRIILRLVTLSLINSVRIFQMLKEFNCFLIRHTKFWTLLGRLRSILLVLLILLAQVFSMSRTELFQRLPYSISVLCSARFGGGSLSCLGEGGGGACWRRCGGDGVDEFELDHWFGLVLLVDRCLCWRLLSRVEHGQVGAEVWEFGSILRRLVL